MTSDPRHLCPHASPSDPSHATSSYLTDLNPFHSTRDPARIVFPSPSARGVWLSRRLERISPFRQGRKSASRAILLVVCLLPYVAGFDFNVRVIAAHQCDSAFLGSLQSTVASASETLSRRGIAPSVNFSFLIFPRCPGQQSLSQLVDAVSSGSGDVTVGLAPYDLQLTFAIFAGLYRSPYIGVNAYASTDVKPFAFSLHPSLKQTSLVLQTLLTDFRWQDLVIVASGDAQWLALASEVYIHMASNGFRVKGRSVLLSPVSANDSRNALGSVPASTKAVILLMEEEDASTLLASASDLGLATSHAFFVIFTNPYHVTLADFLLSKLESNSTRSEMNILNSVFPVFLQFPFSSPTAPSPSARRKRSVTGDSSEYRKSTERTKAFNVQRAINTEDIFVANERTYDYLENHKNEIETSTTTETISLDTGSNLKEREYKRLKDSQRINNPADSRFVAPDDSELLDSSLPESVSHKAAFPGFQSAEDDYSSRTASEEISSESCQICPQTPGGVSRTKRAVISQAASDEDVTALHDVVLLLGYALHRYVSVNNALPSTDLLLKQIHSLDFAGARGQVVIDAGLALFDAVVLDYRDSAGGFTEAIRLNATSALEWRVQHVADVVWPGGHVLIPDDCFMMPENCNTADFKFIYIIAVFATAVGVAIIVAIVVFFVKNSWRYWAKKEMTRGPNKVILSQDDLIFILKKDMGKGSKLLKSRTNLLDSSKPDLLRGSDLTSRSTGSLNELSDFTQTARYNGDLVHVKELKVKSFEMKSKVYTFVRMLRDLRHENINPYMGFLVDPERPALVTEYCSRGSLKDMLHNEDIKLDWDFKLSLLTDLVRGLRYIHSTPLKHHGHLTSMNCVIDSRFVLKITDYGIPGLLERIKTSREFEARDLLWTAPELLRDEELLRRGTDKGDIYSISIIFQEVALRSEPYSSHALTPEEIIKKVKKPPPLCRPSVSPQAAPPQFIQTMKMCWSEMPDMRPSVEEVYEQFKKLTGGKKANIVDTMFKMLEKYSNDLEDIVAERTMQLEEEKKKTDQLLFRMLPSTVAESLKMGRNVQAEQFSEVTIYFSDIVGFTTISARSTPMQVVDLLNDLYTMFDATIELYDVYKVETIGDAYMVVSGLPVRNGNRHAGEVSTMALDLLSQCGHFTIRHMPAVPLRLRIGLHTGPCVAGVVGLTMPRYCLFGDTVNTASRMESTGAAFRVHVSQDCKNALEELGGYHLDLRGETELKGKGKVITYWLVGKEGWTRELPKPPPLTGDDNHGLASLFPELSDPSILFSSASNSTTATATDNPCANPNEHSRPEPLELAVGGEPPRNTEADDSGRGESSDGDSPLSPKTSVSCVQQDQPKSEPDHSDLYTGSGPGSSEKENAKTSPSSHDHAEKSPKKGGNSKFKSANVSRNNRRRNSLQDSARGSNSVVTEAEIYPQAKVLTPEKSNHAITSQSGFCETEMCENAESVEMHPLLGSDDVPSPQTATFEMLDEKRSGKKPSAGEHFVKQKARSKDGGSKPRRTKPSIDGSTNSVVSASDVRLQSELGDTSSRLLGLSDSEDLTPVTEV